MSIMRTKGMGKVMVTSTPISAGSWFSNYYQSNQNPKKAKSDTMGKLVIINYKKINNRWFGDWQIGKIIEEDTHYALQAFHKSGKRSITIVIFREEKIEGKYFETAYQISMLDDSKGVSEAIDDIIYKAVLEDMELFGESLVHYFNTL